MRRELDYEYEIGSKIELKETWREVDFIIVKYPVQDLIYREEMWIEKK